MRYVGIMNFPAGEFFEREDVWLAIATYPADLKDEQSAWCRSAES